MFDIGFSELLLAAIVALVVLGPERMPKAARFAGLWVRKARAQWDSVKGELEREIASDELKRSVQESRDAMRELDAGVRATGDQARREFDALRQATAEPEGFDEDVPRRLESASMPDFADESPVPADSQADHPDAIDAEHPDAGDVDHPDAGDTDHPDAGDTDHPDAGDTDHPDAGDHRADRAPAPRASFGDDEVTAAVRPVDAAIGAGGSAHHAGAETGTDAADLDHDHDRQASLLREDDAARR